jgi:folate-binding protein YgfZ
LKTVVFLEERGVLAVGGPQRLSFLQGLISNDVERVRPDQTIYAALLTPQGKFLFEFFIADRDGVLLLDTDRDRLPDLQKRLMMYKLRSDVTIADRTGDFSVHALLGPVDGLGDAPGAALALDNGVAFTDPRSARLGARAILPRGTAQTTFDRLGFTAGPFEAYEARRVEVGAADSRRDLEVDKTLLLEANFETFNGISFSKGCYVGQELTARTKYRGNVRRRLYPVVIEGVTAPGTEVNLGDKLVGEVRSIAGNRGIALLRIEDVEQARAEGAALTAGGATVRVEGLPA